MGSEGDKRRDPGDAVREGVRSLIGILGALKDAVEDTFEELRTGGEATPDDAREAAKSTFRAAQDAVEDVRERLDFITRKEFDALRAQVAELTTRVNTLSETAARSAAAPRGPAGPAGASGSGTTAGASDTGAGHESATQARPAAGAGPKPAADPRPDERRESGQEGGPAGDFRFEVE